MLLFVLGASVSVAMLIIILFNTGIMAKDYELNVDAIKDNDDVSTMYRVIISNVGRNDITDLVIDYGTYQQFIPIIKAGEKIVLSPSDKANKDKVIVTAVPNIHIVKEYRVLSKMVKVH